MAFALCPDNGLPRLWRFVAAGSLGPNVVTTLDSQQNILRIDKEKFDQLAPLDQHQLLRTHSPIEFTA